MKGMWGKRGIATTKFDCFKIFDKKKKINGHFKKMGTAVFK